MYGYMHAQVDCTIICIILFSDFPRMDFRPIGNYLRAIHVHMLLSTANNNCRDSIFNARRSCYDNVPSLYAYIHIHIHIYTTEVINNIIFMSVICYENKIGRYTSLSFSASRSDGNYKSSRKFRRGWRRVGQMQQPGGLINVKLEK